MISLDLAWDASSLLALARLAGGEAVLLAELTTAIDEMEPAIQTAIEANMHFDRGYATGELENSVEVLRLGPFETEVGTNVAHAKFVDYGTGQRGAGNPGDTHGDPTYHYGPKLGMEGEPYMGPAMVQVEPEIERILIDHMTNALVRIAGVP